MNPQLPKKIAFIILAALSLAACSSSEPEYVDPEAHEKTIQLNEKYGPVLVGTWHFEKIGEKQRYFERLTFQADGTLTGMRKWQMRKLVTINGEQVYTDWEDVELGGWEDEDVKQNGTFSALSPAPGNCATGIPMEMGSKTIWNFLPNTIIRILTLQPISIMPSSTMPTRRHSASRAII